MEVREAGNQETQQLMNLLMNFAQQQLRDQGAFAPFAGWLDRDGAAMLDSSQGGNTELSARDLVTQLTESMRTRVAAGSARAAAVAASVQFSKRGADEFRNAVELHIEHESGYCVDIFVPYRVRRGWRRNAGWRVRFSHPVGQESTQRLFSN